MNIIQALQDKDSRLRISNGCRWLCGDGNGRWTVYERGYHAKKTIILIETNDEELAIEKLLGEE